MRLLGTRDRRRSSRPARRRWPSRHELAAESAGEPAKGHPGGFEICLLDEDVEGAYRRAVETGADAVSEPEEKPWGQRTAYVRDPDGTLIEVASPA